MPEEIECEPDKLNCYREVSDEKIKKEDKKPSTHPICMTWEMSNDKRKKEIKEKNKRGREAGPN